MSKTVGSQLRKEREARSLTLEQVSQTTHIRVHYLQAIEAGEFDSLPSTAQARGFLRSYAGFLNLDPGPLLNALDGEAAIPLPPKPEAVSEQPATGQPQIHDAKEAIFIEIGQRLQAQRELLGLSLDDVERHTHLKAHYLRALEYGDLERLPSPVQGRGMLNNYAAFLGLDPEPLLLRFADGLQADLAQKQASSPQARKSPVHRRASLPNPLRRFGDLLIGGLLAILLILFIGWGAIRIFAMSADQGTTPTAPSIADVLLATSTATTSPTPNPPTATLPQPAQLLPTLAISTDESTGEILPLEQQENVQVYIVIQQRAWMRVIVDGEIAFDGRVIPGSAYPFAGESTVEVQTGNGAALLVSYNGLDLEALGGFGEIVDQVYSQQGILTPTPTISPTSTVTQAATSTLAPSATPESGEATPPSIP